jgi:hypothetical protein
MYEQEDDYAEEGEDSEEISNEIWQEACWIVISAYFDEKGFYKIFLQDLAVQTVLWIRIRILPSSSKQS